MFVKREAQYATINKEAKNKAKRTTRNSVRIIITAAPIVEISKPYNTIFLNPPLI